MPAKSQAQLRYFEFLKSHPKIAAQRGIKSKVVSEFTANPQKGLPERSSKKLNRRVAKRMLRKAT